jgi:tetratricopeptide (TPR) repeat protein
MSIVSVVRGSSRLATLGAASAALFVLVWTVSRPAPHKGVPFTAIADVHLKAGDAYFGQRAFELAEHEYREVMKLGQSSSWYALYRLGWIDFDLERYREASGEFSSVAQATEADQSLRHAAAKDFVRAYAELGDAKAAYATFQRIDRAFAFEMLATLGDVLVETVKYDQACAVFAQLIALAPADPRACLWQYNIAHSELLVRVSPTTETVTEIEKLVRASRAGQTECRDNAAAMSSELARAYHAEAAQTKNATTMGYALRLYKAYVDAFPGAADFAQTKYYYAEALWSTAEAEPNPRLQAGLFETAGEVFVEVAKLPALEPKLRKESAYAGVLAWKNALNGESEGPVPTDVAPVAIPPRTQKLLGAFDVYLHTVDPVDDDAIGIMFIKANTLRRFNHFDEAIAIFKDILAHHADHETAEYSANLLFDTYERTGRHAEADALIDSLLANKVFVRGKPELERTVRQWKRR